MYLFKAPYGSDNGTLIGQLTVEDKDSLIQTFSFQILPSRNSSFFRIRDSAGILEATKKLPEDAGPDGIVINVTVSDGVNRSPTPAMVLIEVPRYTEMFELVGGNHSLSIVENIPVGTEVFNASLTNYTEYQLLPDTIQKIFTINRTTGIICTRGKIDREGRVSPENFKVVAFEENEICKLKTVSNVTLTILDENDNPPTFTTSPNHTVSIPENSANGTSVFKFSATDIDDKENATLTYSITSDNSPFRIDSDTGIVTVTDSSRLDREVSDTLRLVVTVVDGGTTLPQQLRKSASINLTVTVEDVNDNDPIFNQSVYSVSVYEDTLINSTLTVVRATDRDNLNGEIRYSLGDGGMGVFSINSTTGQLRARKALDREQYDSFSFFVIASDLGSPPRSSSARVVVKVLDVNDNIPQFQKIYLPSPIDEGISCSKKAFVKVTAEDKDFGLNSEIVYSIESDLLVINSSTGEVTCKAGGLDYENETLRTFDVVVRATDKGTPPLNSTSVIRVAVRDVNDNPPVFTNTPYNISVRVETFDILNSPILVFAVQDKDSWENSEVDLRLTNPSTGGEGLFTVENSVLIVNRAGPPTRTTFSYTVIATDRGRPPLNTTAFVDIHVSGSGTSSGTSSVTFNPKDFLFKMVEENELHDAAIGQLSVTAQNQASPPVFSLVGASSFSVNSSTGLLFTSKVWDRERDKDSAELTIIAKASTVGDVDYALVRIILVDINDNSPKVLTHKLALVGTVAENAGEDTFIISLEATDSDEGRNGTVIFSLEGGIPFRIETENTTGKILVNGSLDREEAEEYVFTVWVRDNATEPKSVSTTVTILVEDVNDNAPTFVNVAPISVPENTPKRVEGRIVNAIDPDKGKSGTVTFFIDNSTACPFGVELNETEKAWELLLQEELDYETEVSYVCIIVASDEGDIRLSSTATFTILVTDINDNAPVIHSTVSSVNVSRDVNVGYVLVESLDVTDEDSVSKGATFFSFVDPNNSTAQPNTYTGIYFYFNINPATGAVSVKNSIKDFPQDVATLNIVAKDRPANQPSLMSDVIQIHINISDKSTTPQFNPIDNINITEGSLPLPRDLIRVSAFVYERRVRVDNCNCSYSIGDIVSERGNGPSLKESFGINAVSGEITLKTSLDREATGNIIYITLLAADYGIPPKTGTGTLSINVLDINDNSPHFDMDSLEFTLNESSCSAGQIVYNITAHDADAPPNNMIVYRLRQLFSKTTSIKVDNSSGQLSLVTSLCDVHTETDIIATVTASNTDPDKQSFMTVRLKVDMKEKDPNPNAPVFLKDVYETALSFDASVNTTLSIIDFEAKDKDESQNIVYSIENGNCLDVFAFNSKTRVFRLQHPIDATVPDFINITVKATDSGNFPPELAKSGYAKVQITIINRSKQCYTSGEVSALSSNVQLFQGLFIAVVILLVIAIITSVIFIYKWRTAVSGSGSITAPENTSQTHSLMEPNFTNISKIKISGDTPGFPPQLPRRSNAGVSSCLMDSRDDLGITSQQLSSDQSDDSAGYLTPSVGQYDSWEDEDNLGPGRASYLSVISEPTRHQPYAPEFDDVVSAQNDSIQLNFSPPVCKQQHGTYLQAIKEPSTSSDTYLHPSPVSQEGPQPAFSPFFPPSRDDDIPPEALSLPSPLGVPYRPGDTLTGSNRQGFVVRSPGHAQAQEGHDPFGHTRESLI